MKPEAYTFFVASSRKGSLRKITLPGYVLHLLLILAVVGGVTVTAAVGSYTRMLWKVGNYNALRRQQDTLKHNYEKLQSSVQDTNERMNSLQSLATEVAMTYGFMRFRQSPFALSEVQPASDTGFAESIEQFNFLQKNAAQASLPAGSLQLMATSGLGDLTSTPTLWPVIGHLTGTFGERMDPFSGEGAFHTGVDISSQYGDSVRSSADGVVVEADERSGYGRLVVVDHGFGVSTYYGHLSSFRVVVGQQIRRGDAIGNVGVSGRSTGPHVHYEVRINGAPVNPMRYLRQASAAD
ncbi:MAG TPA: M23 family metallopeptidase [Candidatus Acidoferrales bacterium]|jgi:murein DD-endopeptidase MepM/ murein hydrolase activator NlpD|nr:M23 family metallopeptidase [Candidatus Acidoferrales bacterium]